MCALLLFLFSNRLGSTGARKIFISLGCWSWTLYIQCHVACRRDWLTARARVQCAQWNANFDLPSLIRDYYGGTEYFTKLRDTEICTGAEGDAARLKWWITRILWLVFHSLVKILLCDIFVNKLLDILKKHFVRRYNFICTTWAYFCVLQFY